MKIMVVFFLVSTVCIGSCSSKLAANKAGEQLIYSYSSEGTGYSDIQMLYNTDSTVKAQPFFFRASLQTIGVNIRCKIKKTIIASAGISVHVCFEITEPDVKIENGALPVDATMITKEMAMPVFAEMTIAGNILSIKTDTAVSYLTAGIIKNILSNTQAVFPQRNQKSWQVTEENTVGLFKANYDVVHKSKYSVEYLKINTGYEKISSAKKGQKFLPDSKTTIVTNISGAVQRIKISESLITLFGADTIVASGSSMECKLLSAGAIGQQDISALGALEHSGKYLRASALSDPISDEDINRLAYKNTLADDNFGTLTEKLALVNNQDKQYESELVKKFRALAWLSENDCIKMAAVLKGAAAGSTEFRVISHALAAVETPFSINELAAIVAARPNDDSMMAELLPVLATTTTPTGKAADIIRELAFSKTANDFIVTTAQLTLGGMVKNLGRIDPTKADELTDVIVENMKGSQDTLQQLLVYGNTGAYRLLPVLTSYITDPLVSMEMRKAAVFATRLIDHTEAGSLLDKLVIEQDTVLSKAAKETIGFRTEYLHERL